MMTPDELPSTDTVLNANDIVQYGTLALSHILADHWRPYHDIAGTVYQADDFYEVSHNIVMGCWKLASMGDVIKMDELLDFFVDVELYSLPNISKTRKPRGPGMKEDRVTFGHETSTKAILYSALHKINSPTRYEDSRQGKQFRKYYGVPWQVFENFIKRVDEKLSPRRGVHKLSGILFEVRVMACFRHLRRGGLLNHPQA
jgi:hypothetical protein